MKKKDQAIYMRIEYFVAFEWIECKCKCISTEKGVQEACSQNGILCKTKIKYII